MYLSTFNEEYQDFLYSFLVFTVEICNPVFSAFRARRLILTIALEGKCWSEAGCVDCMQIWESLRKPPESR